MTPTLVIADQSPLSARQIALVFERTGYHVAAICHDGLSALEAIKRHQPTVCTLDILLPRLGGLQVAEAIRRMGLRSSVFFITAVSARSRVEAARAAGAAFYALKPLSEDKLAAAARAPLDEENNHASAV